ncbi:unnamed protein product [Adineta steineri]|uniref:Uncharacterized protein n=1 Tax=Adineta steineri TaxID=433720 RepID=A0A815KG92_9BILA|nr:unnamed protein product [Adineta steineri]CAF1395217.1 unnamed protein product [Adineta steineri]
MHHKMVIIIVLIIIGLTGIHSNDELMCNCSCCIDKQCRKISQNDFSVSTCGSCQSICQSKFSAACTKMSSTVSYKCTNGTMASRLLNEPDWIGEFRMTDDCDTESCCCLTDLVQFTRVNVNNLHIQGQFFGQCPRASLTIEDIYMMPNDFSANFNFLNRLVSAKLSSDSRTISFMETDNLACRYKAVRENAASMIAINWMFFILICGIVNVKNYII